MSNDIIFYPIIDPRDYEWAKGDVPKWRSYLRQLLYDRHAGASTLTGRTLHGFDLHESCFPRSVVPVSVSWNWMLFSSVNSCILRPDEHIPQPPTRIESFWLAVGWHSKRVVDEWIISLPFKVPPPTPWRGTSGYRVISYISLNYPVTKLWKQRFFDPRVKHEVNCEG